MREMSEKTMTLTKKLRELREKGKAATSGPWEGDEFEMCAPKAPVLEKRAVRIVWAFEYHMNQWDAEFAKIARNHWDLLLDIIEVQREALEWYASGGKDDDKEQIGYVNEFGCGCCVWRMKAEDDLDYDSDLQGFRAREALEKAESMVRG